MSCISDHISLEAMMITPVVDAGVLHPFSVVRYFLHTGHQIPELNMHIPLPLHVALVLSLVHQSEYRHPNDSSQFQIALQRRSIAPMKVPSQLNHS